MPQKDPNMMLNGKFSQAYTPLGVKAVQALK